MGSWTVIGFFAVSAITLLIAIAAVILESRSEDSRTEL